MFRTEHKGHEADPAPLGDTDELQEPNDAGPEREAKVVGNMLTPRPRFGVPMVGQKVIRVVAETVATEERDGKSQPDGQDRSRCERGHPV